MEELTANINWAAVIVGTIASFALGGLWYSPKMFGKIWMKGVGVSEDDKSGMIPAMIAQLVGTFFMAWVIGITVTTESLLTAILITLTIAMIVKSNGLYAKKSHGAITVECGFIIAMAVVMIAAQGIF